MRAFGSVFLSGLALAAVAACGASPSDPGLRPYATGSVRPVPAELSWEQYSFAGRYGTLLFAQSWGPPSETPIRGVVAIHHGLADHSDRYGDFAIRLARAGYAVWALDMRGHGRSSGERVNLSSPDDLLADLDAFLALVRARHPTSKLFLYGHSVGGLVSALYTIERDPLLAGLILAAPAIAFDAPPLQAAAIQLTNALSPNAAVLETPHQDFSSSPDVVAAMDRDPMIAQRNGPVRTARTILAAVARVWAKPRRIHVPLLAFHGDVDKLTAPSGSRDLVAHAASADKTFRLYPGLAHDVLHEPSSPQVAAELHAWLDAKTGGPALSFTASPTAPEPHLLGDRHGRAITLETGLRTEAPFSVLRDGRRLIRDDAPGYFAELRARATFGSDCGFNYLAGLDLRAGYLAGAAYDLTAHALGVAYRSDASLVSLSTGFTASLLVGDSVLSLPLELAAEAPVGPVRLLGRVSLSSRFDGEDYPQEALIGVDEVSALLGVRLFRDHRYWGSNIAGAGPFFAATYRNLGGAQLWGVAFGAHLFGGN